MSVSSRFRPAQVTPPRTPSVTRHLLAQGGREALWEKSHRGGRLRYALTSHRNGSQPRSMPAQLGCSYAAPFRPHLVRRADRRSISPSYHSSIRPPPKEVTSEPSRAPRPRHHRRSITAMVGSRGWLSTRAQSAAPLRYRRAIEGRPKGWRGPVAFVARERACSDDGRPSGPKSCWGCAVRANTVRRYLCGTSREKTIQVLRLSI
jgi:hypothetical protein